MPLGATRRIRPGPESSSTSKSKAQATAAALKTAAVAWLYGRRSLLDSSLCAGVLELLLDGLGVRLRNAFLDGRRSTFDQVLRFLQAQPRDFADDLDDADFVGAELGNRHGEFGLSFRRRCGSSSAARRGSRYGSSRRDVELLFHVGNQFDHIHDGHLGNRIENFVFSNSHFCLQKTLKGLSTESGLIRRGRRFTGLLGFKNSSKRTDQLGVGSRQRTNELRNRRLQHTQQQR